MTQTEHTTSGDSSSLPLLHFRTTGLPDAEAFAQWRQLMAPLFYVEQARYTSATPRGNLSVFVVGEFIVNRCTFNAQRCWRDPALIETTPDHLLLQYYRSGGYRGTVAGQPVCIVRGQVTVADLRQEMDCYVATSDTIGLSVPRSLLTGIDPAALVRQLDAPRNRLLGGYMATLPKRLGQMTTADIPSLTAELIALLGRIFASDPFDNATNAASLDENVLGRALVMIETHLANPDLSPAVLTKGVGASRASLYRLFGPMGGIMRYVQERRLLAVRDTLDDPLDRRTLSELAVVHGFTSQAVLSRGFRDRFGVSPSDWRQERAKLDLAKREPSPEPVHTLWKDLGKDLGNNLDKDLGQPTSKA